MSRVRHEASRSGSRRRARALAVIAIALVSSLFRASAARAEPPSSAPGWAFGAPGGEVALAAASVASLGTILLPQHVGAWYASSARPLSAPEDALSYVTFGAGAIGMPLLAFVGEAQDARRFGVSDPAGRAAPMLFADLESVLFATGATFAIKRAVGRCRPHVVDRPCRAFDAFPSGHTAPPAAAAAAHVVLALRSPGGGRVAAAMFGEAMTALTALLRVRAGRHSWEDVAGGFVLGAAIGAIVVAAHPDRSLGAAPIGFSSSF